MSQDPILAVLESIQKSLAQGRYAEGRASIYNAINLRRRELLEQRAKPAPAVERVLL